MLTTKTTKITKMPKTRREKEVWEACDELWEELQEEGLPISKLTGEKIKNRLVDSGYSRGNQGQIYKYRNSWQLSRGIEEDDELVLEERQSILSEKVRNSIESLFKEIHEEAEKKVTETKQEADNAIKKFSEKCTDIEKENELLHNKLEKALEELNIANMSSKELSSQLSEEKHKHDIIQEKLKAEEGRANRIAIESKNREQSLNERNEKEKREFQSKMEDLIGVHKKEISTLKEHNEEQRHKFIAEIDNLKVSNGKLDKQLEKTTLLEQKANNVNTELKQRIKILEEEVIRSRKEYKDTTEKLNNSEKIAAETKGELKQVTALFNNQKEEYKNISQQLLDYKEKVGRLEEQLQQTKQENKKLSEKSKNKNK